MSVEIKNVSSKAIGTKAMEFLVLVDGKEAGIVWKHRDTRSSWQPWKAFVGIGEQSRFIGFFWEDKHWVEEYREEYESGKTYGPHASGGKAAAVSAVLEASK